MEIYGEQVNKSLTPRDLLIHFVRHWFLWDPLNVTLYLTENLVIMWCKYKIDCRVQCKVTLPPCLRQNKRNKISWITQYNQLLKTQFNSQNINSCPKADPGSEYVKVHKRIIIKYIQCCVCLTLCSAFLHNSSMLGEARVLCSATQARLEASECN